jgi:2-polyprenyl-6-methoxyphenol hydroxylase-like FAD-dependent oxidoreductase
MRCVVLGAGPAGLYFSYLLKRARPDADIRIVEQNGADSTFGFGVVFSDRALEFLREDDPETYHHITPHMEIWDDLTLDHGGERIALDGIGFAAIGRLELLKLLQERLRSVGLEPEFETAVSSLDELGEADLLVGADGANSIVRVRHDETLRNPEPRLPPQRARQLQCPSLPLRARPQHLHC